MFTLNMIIAMAKFISKTDGIDSICRNTICDGGCLIGKDHYDCGECGMKEECTINHFSNEVGANND